MNDFKTLVIPLTTVGAGGFTFVIDFKLAEGRAAKIHSIEAYSDGPAGGNLRTGMMWAPIKQQTPSRPLFDENDLLRTPAAIWRFMYREVFAAGGTVADSWPVTQVLWDLDYRVITRSQMDGFAAIQLRMGVAIRYKVVNVSPAEVAAILFWQQEGLKTS